MDKFTDNTLTYPQLYIKAHWDLKFQVYEHFFFSSPNYSTERLFYPGITTLEYTLSMCLNSFTKS